MLVVWVVVKVSGSGENFQFQICVFIYEKIRFFQNFFCRGRFKKLGFEKIISVGRDPVLTYSTENFSMIPPIEKDFRVMDYVHCVQRYSCCTHWTPSTTATQQQPNSMVVEPQQQQQASQQQARTRKRIRTNSGFLFFTN